MSLKLQPRDRNILDALARYGVFSTNQVGNLFFKGVAHTTLMKRLRLLEKENWLKRGATLNNAENTFSLGFKANALYPERESNRFSNRSTIHHDVLLSSVRLRLEGLNLAKEWTPEFEIRAKALRNQWRSRDEIVIPDGLWIESIHGEFKAIAVELELTVKSRARYLEIFKRHFIFSGNIFRYFYVVNTARDAKRIIEAAEKAEGFNVNWLWFSLVDSILNESDPAVYFCSMRKWIRFSAVGFDAFKSQNTRDKIVDLPTHGVSRIEAQKSDVINDSEVIDSKEERLLKVA